MPKKASLFSPAGADCRGVSWWVVKAFSSVYRFIENNEDTSNAVRDSEFQRK